MNNTVSINSSITVDSYEIIDDLNIVEETVKVNIVNALFTSIQPDWDINNSDSPYFIRNKPTKTSDFINDGSNGLSRYVELSELTDLNRINDVQLKTTGAFESVVTDKVARIDLSNYVVKEFKTDSNSIYKVLSDNNYTDLDKSKVESIRINGDGSLAFTNNGTYKSLYNILSVNNIVPDENKNISITTDNIEYNSEILSTYLNNLVQYDSPSDKSIVLGNNKFLLGKNTLGTNMQLIGIDSLNKLILGNSTSELNILSGTRPTINTDEFIAYLSDINSSITYHNNSNTSHSDIRNEISSIESHMVISLTNQEMTEIISEDSLKDNSIVIPIDNGEYIKGKIYIYTNKSFLLLAN